MRRVLFLSVLLLLALFTAGDVLASAWPGPDTLGYSGTNVPFSFTDISATGTAVSLADDAISPAVQIGFPFSFYALDYTELYISSNGFITFDAGFDNGCCEGQNIPSAFSPNNLIAGYWGDLDPSGGGSIHYQTAGAPGSRSFTLQFLNVPIIGGTGTATFQIILHEGFNTIEMQFQDCTANAQQIYTTGIENSDGTSALQHSYGNYSLSGLGILFSPPVITITTQPASQSICSGSGVTFTAGATSTPMPASQWEISTNSGSTWNSLPGETAASLAFTTSPAQNNNQYRAVFTSGTRAVSNAAVLTVRSLTTVPSSLPSGTVGSSYTPVQFSTTGGAGAVTYAITNGLLPAGMTLTPDGLLSGSPAQKGSFLITVTATDAGGCTSNSSYTLAIGLNNTITVPAATGNGDITLTTNSPGCWFSHVATKTESQAGSDTAFDYPFGLVEFTVNCAQADVTITFPGNIAGSLYRKYGPVVPGNSGTTAWYTFNNAAVGGNSVVLHLADGQQGDDTGVDGLIADAGGPAQPLSAASVTVPTMTQWGMILFALLAGVGSVYYLGRRPALSDDVKKSTDNF